MANNAVQEIMKRLDRLEAKIDLQFQSQKKIENRMVDFFEKFLHMIESENINPDLETRKPIDYRNKIFNS